MIRLLMDWLEEGVSKEKITGYALLFKKQLPCEMNPNNTLKVYSALIEHVSLGQAELHVVIEETEVRIHHKGIMIERLLSI
ncbi:hypothetical protein [Bacillus paranthracis]|uniref:hypothetical protein n=1 Tax=Bacillus paranthracis TaxID=2026186 RepID=UPI002D791AB7|nr:hypothetical protein [Bacillus paranthracis]